MSNLLTTPMRILGQPLLGTAAVVTGLLVAAAILPPLVNPHVNIGVAASLAPAPAQIVDLTAILIPLPQPAVSPIGASVAPIKPTLTAKTAPAAALVEAKLPHPKLRPVIQFAIAQSVDNSDLKLLNLPAVRAGAVPVARTAHQALPDEYHQIASVEHRKGAFFSVVLPLVLLANEEILAERRRLSRAYAVIRTGGVLHGDEVAWLDDLATRYETDPADIEQLLNRVDIVPPALALAQAAEESGWGSSRFARQGNALFGEWTWTEGEGIVPTGRPEGATYAVKAFDSLLDSVRSYADNLNTNAAYADLRALRASMRAEAEALDAGRLAGTLLRYSQRGEDYVNSLRTIIRANDLEAFTAAKLTRA